MQRIVSLGSVLMSSVDLHYVPWICDVGGVQIAVGVGFGGRR